MMLEKLQKIEERLREVERQLADPAVYTDQQKLARLMREQKELAPVVSVYHALLRAQQAQEEAEQMLSDPELRELALDLAQAFFNFLQLFQHHRHSASRRWTFCTKSPSQKS